jgi:dihydroorotase
MKLKNGTWMCGATLALAVSVVAYGQQPASAAPNATPTATQTGRRGAPNGYSRSGNAPYQSSPEAYQNSGPFGCQGCPSDADRASGDSAVRTVVNQAGQARNYVNGQLEVASVGGGRAQARGRAQVAGGNAAAAAPQGPRRVGPVMQPNTLPYDLLLKGGHVIDEKNHIDKVSDVGIKDGKIAAVGENLKDSDALKTIDAAGLYVVPGLIDIHVHVYASTGEAGSYAGDESIWPDGFTFRSGVTTVVDAGSSGWRNFEDFKEHVIDRSQTRVLADLNIVGAGMRGGRYEDNLDDMDGQMTGYMAKRYPGVVVGIKSAHYTGPEWKPYIEAVKAGTIANIPVMIDYGANRIERPVYELLTKYLRPGDIYTHTFSGLRGEQDPRTLGPQKGLTEGRARGVYFDAGTGGGSFRFRVAVPLIKDGFKPDSLSTDLHTGSMNSSTKDMLNVMSKFMAMGETLQEVVAQASAHPAKELKLDAMGLGALSVGNPADIAVIRDEKGTFGYEDMDYMKMMGTNRLDLEMTIKGGRIVYDTNGLSMDVWNSGKTTSDPAMARHWTQFGSRPPLPDQLTPSAK